MDAHKKIRIGDLLVKEGKITEAQLQDALSEQNKTGARLGSALVTKGYITEYQFLGFLAHQLKLPLIDLKQYDFDESILPLLSETQARRFRAIPLAKDDDGVLLGMVDPMDLNALDELGNILKHPVKLALVSEQDLLRSLDLYYRKTEVITGFAEELAQELSDSGSDFDDLAFAESEQAPVAKLLQSILEDAVQIGASDIHIEPDENVLRIRQRVDGLLQEHVMDDVRICKALTLRLKLMSGLNISERRLPQDGRFHINVKGHSIDVRLSTMPVRNGESVVMRLLDQTVAKLTLDNVGMPAKLLERFRRLVHTPHGMVLVTGPTGSGKTTTLYGALSDINKPESKIITVEDPIEYQLPRINQVQVNPKIDLTFSRVLRAALRQDPDIVLIGEIRDQETAAIGLRAAMTGHLVLATLHTNDVVSSASRLIDMGVEGYLVAAALQGILAQRLVRKICKNCTTDHKPNAGEVSWLSSYLGEEVLSASYKTGLGCSQCKGTGYHGRVGVYELLEIDETLANALRSNDHTAFANAAKQQRGNHTLYHSAIDLAEQGITTLSEVLRLAGELE